jgi:hypothetical protein
MTELQGWILIGLVLVSSVALSRLLSDIQYKVGYLIDLKKGLR